MELNLKLRAGDEDKIPSVVIGVRLFGAAQQYLVQAGLLGEFSEGEIPLLKSCCAGLRFRFRQTTA